MSARDNKAAWEMWAYAYALRGLGFSADDIFASQAKEANPANLYAGMTCGYVVLRAQGRPEFRINGGPMSEMTEEQLREFWRVQCERAEKLSVAERKRRYEASHAFAERTGFVVTLLSRGFKLGPPLGDVKSTN